MTGRRQHFDGLGNGQNRKNTTRKHRQCFTVKGKCST